MKLLITGFVQVFFVAANTYLIAQRLYIGIFFAAFMISIIWSWNIKKIAISTMQERIIYSFGAAIGSVCGVYATDLLIKYL
jgi:hypothetical protein